MAPKMFVNNGSDKGLLPDGTSHYLNQCWLEIIVIIPVQFHQKVQYMLAKIIIWHEIITDFFASAFILIKQSFELRPCWKMSNWKPSNLLAWWCHGMDEFSALVALCDGNLQSLDAVMLMVPSLGVLQSPDVILQPWWIAMPEISNYLTLYVLFFFSKTINMYLLFLSFFHTDLTQVVEILSHIRQRLT